MTKRKRALLVALAIFILFVAYTGWGIVRSLYLESTLLSFAIERPGGVTATLRMAQVSDLHLAVYGENNQALVDLVASKKPDLILSTGDMIDMRTETIDATVDLFRRLIDIAPVAFSLGNHEIERESESLFALLDALSEMGVAVLNNTAMAIERNGIELLIGGLYVPELYPEMEKKFGKVDILLCHLPQKFALLSAHDIPLIFSGHTHGGQFRLPLLDVATYAPGQGFFPKYTKGLYEEGSSRMIVSRGLGNSSFPFRVHNPPEVIIADVTYTPAH